MKEKINFNQDLLGLGGIPIKVGDTDKNICLRDAISGVMLAPDPSEKDEVIKLKKFTLCQRFYQEEGEIEISVDEMKLIKDEVGKKHSSLLVGSIYKMLGLL